MLPSGKVWNVSPSARPDESIDRYTFISVLFYLYLCIPQAIEQTELFLSRLGRRDGLMGDYSKYRDTELVFLITKSDEAAFREIYDRFFGLLYVHAAKLLDNDEEIKDLIQDFFLSLWNNRHRLELKGPFSSYAYTAVRYRVINTLLRQKTSNKYLDSLQGFIDHESVQTDFLVREKELIAKIEKEIEALPPATRRIFRMSRFEVMSHKQIAEKLEISESTVRSQVKSALRVLRTKLGTISHILFL